MIENVSANFSVSYISQNGKKHLFIGIKDLFYQLVVCENLTNYYPSSNYATNQYHIHRLEFTDALLSLEDSLNKRNDLNIPQHFMCSNGVVIISGAGSVWGEFILEINKRKYTIDFDKTPSLKTAIEQDIASIKSINAKENEADGIDNILMLFNKPTKKDRALISSNIMKADKKILEFEKSLYDKKLMRHRMPLVSRIYAKILVNDLEHSKMMLYSLQSNLEDIYSHESCECNAPGCLFELCKCMQRKHFNVDILGKDGKLDIEKVNKQFDLVWQNLREEQKATLLFLDDYLENSILLNLNFLEENFNIDDYLFRYCYCLAPDSPDEQYIRTVANIANYFIKNRHNN